MSDSPPIQSDARQTLRQVLIDYGPDVRLDPRRCEALLRDLCPGGKRDVTLLLTALRERIPDDLLAAQGGQPVAVLVARLAKRLVDTLGLADDAARWAVASWAIALGLATEDDLPAPAPAPPPYVPPAYVPPAPPPLVPPRAPLPPDWRRPQPPVRSPASARAMRIAQVSAGVGVAALAGLFALDLTHHTKNQTPYGSGSYQPAATSGYSPDAAPPVDQAGQPVRHWEAAKPVSALALSPDGKTVATGGFKLITLWDADTGKKLHDIPLSPPPHPPSGLDESSYGAQPGEVERLCFSPDGRHLASTDWGILTLRNAQTGQKERTPALPTTLLTSSDMGTDAQGHWIQSTSQSQVATASQHVLTFSPDGKSLVADADGSSLLAWDLGTGRRRSVLAKTDAEYLAFSPDGKTLAGGGSDGVVRWWDAATGRQTHTARVASKSAADDPYGHTQYFKDVNAVAFAPDGKLVATSHLGDNNVRLWDAHTGAASRVIPTGIQNVYALTFRPDGTFVCLQPDGLTLRDGTTGGVRRTFLYQPPKASGDTFESYPRVYALSADGQTLAAGGNGNRAFDLDGKIVAIWKVTK